MTDFSPLISITVPTYNAGEYLTDSLCSIFNSTYKNIEIIIIDGGSTDNTLQIIDNFKDSITYFESKPDRGQSHAINKGFRRSKGKYITWLCADDIVYPDTYKNAVAYMEKNIDCGITCGHLLVTNETLIPLFESRIEKITFTSLLTEMSSVLQPGSLYRKEAVEKIGYLNEKYHFAMDLDLFIRVSEKKYTIKVFKKVVAIFRIRTGSKTNDQPIKFIQEKLALYKKFGFKTFLIRIKVLSSLLKMFIKTYLLKLNISPFMWYIVTNKFPSLFSDKTRGSCLNLIAAKAYGGLRVGKKVHLINIRTLIIGRNVQIADYIRIKAHTIPMNTILKNDGDKKWKN